MTDEGFAGQDTVREVGERRAFKISYYILMHNSSRRHCRALGELNV